MFSGIPNKDDWKPKGLTQKGFGRGASGIVWSRAFSATARGVSDLPADCENLGYPAIEKGTMFADCPFRGSKLQSMYDPPARAGASDPLSDGPDLSFVRCLARAGRFVGSSTEAELSALPEGGARRQERRIHGSSCEATRRVPRPRRERFETAIIERYRRRESRLEKAWIEMYPAGAA